LKKYLVKKEMKRKKPNKKMLELYRMQKEYGCVLCKRLNEKQTTPTEIHHLRKGMGMSQRNIKCIPLCRKHHRENKIGYHGLGRKGFEEKYNCTEEELLSAYEVGSGNYINWTLLS
tara:strand:- start:182 stop:529 length:348 start_codon:yes stop_codon:yes gene_type:complete